MIKRDLSLPQHYERVGTAQIVPPMSHVRGLLCRASPQCHVTVRVASDVSAEGMRLASEQRAAHELEAHRYVHSAAQQSEPPKWNGVAMKLWYKAGGR